MGWVRRDTRGTFLTGVLLLSLPVLMAAALYPAPVAFAAAVAVSYAAEYLADRSACPMLTLLGRIHFGTAVRFLTRETSAVLLVARMFGADSRWFVLLCGGLLLMHALRMAQTGLVIQLNRLLRLMPVETRNIDVAALSAPQEPPGGLDRWRGARMFHLGLLPVGAIAADALIGRPALGAAGLGAAVALRAGAAAVLLWHARRAAPLADRERLIAAVDLAVRAGRPEVIFYFSGPATSIYQATMWLHTLERLSRRVIVVLRERELLGPLGPTTLPVVCVPSAVDLMNLRGLTGARLALYASNVGKNIHMLRVPGLRSAFIGHGDSDKEASFNPFSKVYDEVWVAGPAGRDRYLRAGVGVRDEDIVEVGRPQLAGIRRCGPGLPAACVLYAPTWEGWTDDLFHTSLIAMGPALVRGLLAHGPAVRLIYKPHPLTGRRDPRATAAHREIVAMIDAAPADGNPAHQVVTGSEPHLYDCFNDCDLLVTDISSLVADFIASGKPYAVTNVAGMAPHAFRERYPSAEAAYLLGPGLPELPAVLAQLRRAGGDELARARREMKAYLLGPDLPDAMTRFDEAVCRASDMAALDDTLRL